MRLLLCQMLFCQLLTFSLSSLAENGGISLGQTRVIFLATDNAQIITVSNSGQQTYLIQARVQSGQEGTTSAPFIVTPPLFSLPGNSSQLLRLLPQAAPLPSDRESLFYLAVSAIPAQSEPITMTNRLSVGVRFIIKLFYRPQKLMLPANNAPCLLTFRQEGHGMRVTNPTGYFQTLGGLDVDGRTVEPDQKNAMVPPYGSTMLDIDGPVHHLTWQTITDYGGLSSSCQQTGLTAVKRAS
ncbi:fimbrial biogenesis chaperone [Serratia marcescens]|uniref:fimbrial biogenesis chaperone n=1 Tax=Serratia marcescens TaxID=615 RepID=UPI003EE370C8